MLDWAFGFVGGPWHCQLIEAPDRPDDDDLPELLWACGSAVFDEIAAVPDHLLRRATVYKLAMRDDVAKLAMYRCDPPPMTGSNTGGFSARRWPPS